jgi:hypothetical protein
LDAAVKATLKPGEEVFELLGGLVLGLC